MLLTASILLMALEQVVRVNVEGAWLCPPIAVLALDSHNEVRALHGVPPLTLDDDLVKRAEKCSEYYALKRKIDHTCPYKNGSGENIIGGVGSWLPTYFATDGPKLFYSEISRYDYNNPDFGWMQTGHFTQVVWKSSEKLGYGVTALNGYIAGVGLYYPPGNVQGGYRENVLPLAS